MRDKRFIAEHRGGSLTKDQHRQLILWACKCVENVLPLIANKVDERLTNAIRIAKEWTKDNASVGDARNSSFNSIAVAKVHVKMYEFNYDEFLSFHKLDNRWMIVNKMITDVTEKN